MASKPKSPNQPPRAAAGAAFWLGATRVEADKAAPGLHVVATPIGNLEDVTIRALKVLAGADRIVCEDTRITRRLLQRYGIEAPLVAYHDHNAGAVRPKILKWLAAGEALALVSDAGTPLISDPGHKLVAAALEAGAPVDALPGPSAALAALVVSGLPADQFLFAGFLPQKKAARRDRLAALKAVPSTLIVYESPNRAAASLADMAEIFGPRQAALARELTKLHEEVLRGTLGEIAAEVAGRDRLKGEVVIVVGPPAAGAAASEEEIDAQLAKALETLSVRDAADMVAALTGVKKRTLYARALELSGRTGQQ